MGVQTVEDACIDRPYKETIKCINVHCSPKIKKDSFKDQSDVISNVSVSNNTLPQIYRVSQECQDCRDKYAANGVEDSDCNRYCSSATELVGQYLVYIVLVIRLYLI